MRTLETLHPATAIGAVHLTVRDLEGEVAFHVERLGFEVLRRESDVVHLGAGGPDLLVLWSASGAPRVRGSTGLYHLAVCVPSRRDLARVLDHLRVTRTPLQGASDHGVSEALYLSDPEGNGLEIYRDRPRAAWPLDDAGLWMPSAPLDLETLLAEADAGEPWPGLPGGTRIGHVHLTVSNLVEAERFYIGILGFDVMQRVGDSALFVSAGGYHHHVALNTWAGVGAPPPPPGAAGLRHFEIQLPDAGERERLLERARTAGLVPSDVDGEPSLIDPSGHRIVFTAAAREPTS
jgi:catechol 2,3-dioxygenase